LVNPSLHMTVLGRFEQLPLPKRHMIFERFLIEFACWITKKYSGFHIRSETTKSVKILISLFRRGKRKKCNFFSLCLFSVVENWSLCADPLQLLFFRENLHWTFLFFYCSATYLRLNGLVLKNTRISFLDFFFRKYYFPLQFTRSHD